MSLQNCGVFMVVVKHWLCQPCCGGSAQRVNAGIQALLVHTGVILPCSCLGQGLGGVFQTRRAGKHVEVCLSIVESFWTCRENKAVKTKKETDVRSHT